MDRPEDVRGYVRQRYAAAAVAVTAGATAGCCDLDTCGAHDAEMDLGSGAQLYTGAERAALPAEAIAASLGCGNPLAMAELHKARPCSTSGPGVA